MNKLSWILYLGDLVGSLNIFLGLAIGAVSIGFAVLLLSLAINAAAEYGDRPKAAAWETFMKVWSAAKSYGIPIVVGLWLAAIIVPGQRTFYMIAASELGEAVATTPQAQAILDKLQEKVMSYLEVDEKAKDKE